ncbi:MAG: anti-sigma factor [Myxococcota bacterium]
MNELHESRLAELLCDRAVGGLTLEEQSELEELQSVFGAGEDPSLELTAATVHRALVETEGLEPMPTELATAIRRGFSRDIVGERPTRSRTSDARILPLPVADDPGRGSTLQGQTLEDDVLPDDTGRPTRAPLLPNPWAVAWPMAAAACVAFVLGGLAGVNSPRRHLAHLHASGAVSGVRVPPEREPGAEVREARSALLAEAEDLVRIAWDAAEDPAAQGATGEIVWSPSRQEGYMSFTGLRRNDASEARYQLWIFDQKRDQRYPVDGGVFDIETSISPTIVPVAATLPVSDPRLFAVTVEAPQGSVVSGRERVVLTAAMGD